MGLMVRSGDTWEAATQDPILQHSPTNMLFQDSDRSLWVSSNSLSMGRLRDGLLTEVIAEKNPTAVKGVIAAFEDRERNLWFGSQWVGLVRMWNGSTRRLSAAEGLLEPIVWSVARADGRTWVGTNDGLSVFSGGRFTQVLRGDQLPHPHAYNLLAEGDRIWIGTRRGLVLYRDGKIGIPGPVRAHGQRPDQRHRARALGRGVDPHQRRLVPARRRAPVALRQRGGPERHPGAPDPRTERRAPAGGHPGRPVRTARRHPAPDRPGPRAAVQAGRDRRGRAGRRLARDQHPGRRHLSVQRTRLEAIQPQRGAAAERGLLHRRRQCLGFLWEAGIRGITRAALSEMRLVQNGQARTAYAEMILNERGDRRSGEQGLLLQRRLSNAKGFMDQAGVLWLPSRDGVVTLDTLGIAKNMTAPTAVIERVRINDQWQDVRPNQKLALSNDARDLAFEFTALSFQDPVSVVLRYRLHGYDKDWRELEAGAPRSVNYTNLLRPGTTPLKSRPATMPTSGTRRQARLDFSIAPLFWETSWFLALVGFGLIGTVYA
ncbi:hypothetical protein LP419_00570 [Massilia sp. H-1]|nr:hypothetical protein LP419_00570 [Massilia sp. H-1]